MNRITFVIDQAEEGGYNAHAETESIYTQAETFQQLNVNIAEALKCHFGDEVVHGFTLKFVENK